MELRRLLREDRGGFRDGNREHRQAPPECLRSCGNVVPTSPLLSAGTWFQLTYQRDLPSLSDLRLKANPPHAIVQNEVFPRPSIHGLGKPKGGGTGGMRVLWRTQPGE